MWLKSKATTKYKSKAAAPPSVYPHSNVLWLTLVKEYRLFRNEHF